MSEEPEHEQKIIIDSDWKSQAQAEKERLAQQEAASAADPGAAGAEGGLPPASFRSLVDILAAQAIMYLGGVQDRQTGQAVFDPMAARHMIDLLGVLEEKTKGNITEEEANGIGEILAELRSRFVELSRAVAAQQAQQGPGGAGPNPAGWTDGGAGPHG